MFMMSAVTRCILQSLLKLPASNDYDTLLLLPSLLVGSAAQLRSLLQVRRAASISSQPPRNKRCNFEYFCRATSVAILSIFAGLQGCI